MAKYSAPSTAPSAPTEFQIWILDELRHITDALSEFETDTVLFKQFNAEPSRLYDGLIAYADGTNWNPGSGQGFYGYYAAAWHLLG